jgi:hypothetical protein
MAHRRYGRRETLRDWATGNQVRLFVITRCNCPHVAARIGMNRTGILALDLFAPVPVVRHSGSVAWFVHCSRLLSTDTRQSTSCKGAVIVCD